MAISGHLLQMAGKWEAGATSWTQAVALKPREKGQSMSATKSAADPVAALKEAHRVM
jgi:hypothetical protein